MNKIYVLTYTLFPSYYLFVIMYLYYQGADEDIEPFEKLAKTFQDLTGDGGVMKKVKFCSTCTYFLLLNCKLKESNSIYYIFAHIGMQDSLNPKRALDEL